ncbi:MAG: rhomboid family intramembrane serine protease [Cyanobacteria bacterium]|nr:rhomboid family intramembrane serine protease [Cyanobacteriota bacterium]
MITTSDAMKAKKILPVTAIIVVANLIVYACMCLQYGSKSVLIPSTNDLLEWGASFGPLTLAGQPWRLISCAFLHGNPVHLLVNMYVLWRIGALLERAVGPVCFILIYMITAVAGSLASVAWQPTAVSVGASGATLGILGAILTCRQGELKSINLKINKKRQVIVLSIFILLTVLMSLVMPSIDNACHLGGFVAGLILGFSIARGDAHHMRWLPSATLFMVSVLCALIFHFVADAHKDDKVLAGHRELLIGFQQMKDKRFKEAIEHFDKARDLAPDEVVIRINRARNLFELDRYEEALDDINKALAKESDNSSLVAMKGLALSHLGRYVEAEQVYQRAIDKDKKSVMLHNDLAWSQLAQGKLEAALKNVDKALEMDGSQYAALDTRAVAYLLMDKPARALVDLNTISGPTPDDSALRFHRALVLLELGHSDEAAEDYKAARKLKYQPDNWELKRFAPLIERLEKLSQSG